VSRIYDREMHNFSRKESHFYLNGELGHSMRETSDFEGEAPVYGRTVAK
jgi:hypothetical protein